MSLHGEKCKQQLRGGFSRQPKSTVRGKKLNGILLSHRFIISL